jgi:hypothetical protein
MDVDLERTLPFVITDIRNILERGLVGGIVDEDIDSAELIDGTLNDGAAVIWLSQVSGKQDSLAAFLLDESLTSSAS